MSSRAAGAVPTRAETTIRLDVAIHRRILNFLNEATQPQDLMADKPSTPNPEMTDHDAALDHPEQHTVHRRKILDADIAAEIIEFRVIDRLQPR